MYEGLIYAAFYGFLLAFAVGPVFFSLMETALTKGFRAAMFLDLGAFLADILFILIAYYSTNHLLEKLQNDPGLLVFGGVILISYGVISYIQTNRSIFKIVRDHYSLKVKKNHGGLFLKGFLLNFINFGVLAAWIGTIVVANALTTSEKGVIAFLVTVLITFYLIDMIKIAVAKRLKKKMTPRFTLKTKKWISLLMIGFGTIILLQGIFPSRVESGLEKISGKSEKTEYFSPEKMSGH